MKTVLNRLLIAAQGALLVLSVVAVFEPEARGLPMRLLIVPLYLVCCLPGLCDLPSVMHKTPREAALLLRGKVSVLESLALTAGTAAVITMFIYRV